MGGGCTVKESIRQFSAGLGADVVGFASVADYGSSRSPDPATTLRGVKSMVVLGYREVNGSLESENTRSGMAARMGCMELMFRDSYLLARYLEGRSGAKAAVIAPSYPLDMGPDVLGLRGDVSLRHAAVAAGLGVLGRHNLLIHPRLGTRIVLSAVLTDLVLESDPPVEQELCDDCGLCVEACPARALADEGKTHVFRCLKVSQAFGIRALYKYLQRFVGASPEQQRALLKEPALLQTHQATGVGFQYTCNRCMAVCPAAIDS
jgi:epoxyqueuosine reductase QueG